MEELFDLSKFDEYKEDNRREVKSSAHGLPESLWETYCSFANTEGGVIILGVKERKDKTWYTTGLKDASKLEKEFWDLINNHQKVSQNILFDRDFKTYSINGDIILVIHVPMAHREQKPIYKGSDMFSGTYRRNGEGDYLCTKSQVLAMLRDQTEETPDMKIVDQMSLSDLNQDTIRGYRNMHQNISDRHPFSRLNQDEYLRSIGAAAISEKDGKLHPTAAGLLMFGNDYDIVREFPEYFLDFREQLDPSIRWTDRLWSTAGTWSGNVFDFFLRAYSKIALGLKVPFRMEGILRVDDTPIHKAVREALVNCLSNADYYGVRGIIIRKTPSELILENPGNIRTGKRQMIRGGISDPRNKTILKMFNLLDIGERSGSGVPNIFNVWADQGWAEPIITEETSPDRTRITLIFGTETEPQINRNGTANETVNDTVNDTDPIIRLISTYPKSRQPVVTRIIRTIKSDERQTVQQIADKVGISRSTALRYIKQFQTAGILVREGSDKNGRWVLIQQGTAKE